MDLTNIGFMKIRRQTTVLSIILIVISIYSLFVNKFFVLDECLQNGLELIAIVSSDLHHLLNVGLIRKLTLAAQTVGDQ